MRSKTNPKISPVLSSALLVLLSVVATAILVESAFLLLPKPMASPEHEFWKFDPSLGWTHIENAEGLFENQALGFRSQINIDRRGLRDNENGTRNCDKTLLILGDSVVAGFEVAGRDTFSSVLERRLRESGQSYCVLNAGVRGYGTDQDYWRMKVLLPTLKPDAVLYVFTWNDLFDNVTVKNRFRLFSKPAYVLTGEGQLRLENFPTVPRPKGFYEYVYANKEGQPQKIWGEFHTSGFIDSLRKYSRIFAMGEDFYFQYFVGPPARDGIETIPAKYESDLLREIIKCMKKDAPKLMITSFVSDKEALNDKLDVIEAAARDEEIPFIDLRPYFKSGPGQIVPNDGHWNVLGHRAAANGLYDYFHKPKPFMGAR